MALRSLILTTIALFSAHSNQLPPPYDHRPGPGPHPVVLLRPEPGNASLHLTPGDPPFPTIICSSKPMFQKQEPLDPDACRRLATVYDEEFMGDTELTHDDTAVVTADMVLVPWRRQEGDYGVKVDYFGGSDRVPDLDQGYTSYIGRQICDECAKRQGGNRYGARARVSAKDVNGKDFVFKMRIIKYTPPDEGAVDPVDDKDEVEEEIFKDWNPAAVLASQGPVDVLPVPSTS